VIGLLFSLVFMMVNLMVRALVLAMRLLVVIAKFMFTVFESAVAAARQ